VIERMITKEIKIGNIKIGNNNPIAIQSMTTTKTSDILATTNQILDLEQIGCEIIRVAIPDMESANAIKEIKKNIHIPLVADIHFDYKLALKAIEMGIDKVRLNPGNISDENKIKEVVDELKRAQIPIRIGVNSGSVEKDILLKHGGHPTPDALIESALRHVRIVEKFGYDNIVISMKSSNAIATIESYKKMSKLVNYPLHLGITEAGTEFKGTILSSIGIGNILLDGIGDTFRVSLTGDPKLEIPVAKGILESLDIRRFGPRIVSCPTCGRCNIALANIAIEVEKRVSNINKNLTIAIMGCAVNGPGEAKEADIGIAGGLNEAILFKKGEIIKKLKNDEIVEVLVREVENW
jgi:(E)-4-hydroxy-3-methylbut-2-enyl-diphosphate synthase